jgi:hypothetical protein
MRHLEGASLKKRRTFAFVDLKGVKYWEIIADNLNQAGWNWGCVSAVDSSGRTSISGIIPRPCSSRSRCLGRLCNRGSLC